MNAIYGGSGAGALNDLYDRVTLLEGLENEGFELNANLIERYKNLDKKELIMVQTGVFQKFQQQVIQKNY